MALFASTVKTTKNIPGVADVVNHISTEAAGITHNNLKSVDGLERLPLAGWRAVILPRQK